MPTSPAKTSTSAGAVPVGAVPPQSAESLQLPVTFAQLKVAASSAPGMRVSAVAMEAARIRREDADGFIR